MAVDQSRAAKFAMILKQLLKLTNGNQAEIVMFMSLLSYTVDANNPASEHLLEIVRQALVDSIANPDEPTQELANAIADYLK